MAASWPVPPCCSPEFSSFTPHMHPERCTQIQLIAGDSYWTGDATTSSSQLIRPKAAAAVLSMGDSSWHGQVTQSRVISEENYTVLIIPQPIFKARDGDLGLGFYSWWTDKTDPRPHEVYILVRETKNINIINYLYSTCWVTSSLSFLGVDSIAQSSFCVPECPTRRRTGICRLCAFMNLPRPSPTWDYKLFQSRDCFIFILPFPTVSSAVTCTW